jgi:hypothetical protein
MMPRRRSSGIVPLLLLFLFAAGLAEAASVNDAALAVYLHGMTAEIADRDVGKSGVGELLRLLDDPTFPRRDNVVAFLAYLGGPESTAALLRMLERRLPADASPEDQRARLLIPHALGRIASRGESGALAALLAMTASRAADRPSAVSADLREAAVAALPLTGTPAARERLAAIADGRVVPDEKHPELAARARAALRADTTTPAAAPAPASTAAAYLVDPATHTNAHGLTFVNHANVTAPMTATRLDAVLKEGSFRAAKGDFATDVACCTIIGRSGGGGTFGANGDGLDTINDSPTLNAVLGVASGRVKIVNVINWCGGSGTNIIGCSYQPGNGMVLVRLSSTDFESVLWVHEYGHNLGLAHAMSDSRMIMYPSDNGGNDGLQPTDCAAFHSPAPQAQAMISVSGSCTDDGDSYADPIDNCPLVANEDQLDSDGNGVGDACQTGPLAGDIDRSGRVDGGDLSILGRAFGATLGSPRYVAAADINHDGVIDGNDLALLASQFGQ